MTNLKRISGRGCVDDDVRSEGTSTQPAAKDNNGVTMDHDLINDEYLRIAHSEYECDCHANGDNWAITTWRSRFARAFSRFLSIATSRPVVLTAWLLVRSLL